MSKHIHVRCQAENLAVIVNTTTNIVTLTTDWALFGLLKLDSPLVIHSSTICIAAHNLHSNSYIWTTIFCSSLVAIVPVGIICGVFFQIFFFHKRQSAFERLSLKTPVWAKFNYNKLHFYHYFSIKRFLTKYKNEHQSARLWKYRCLSVQQVSHYPEATHSNSFDKVRKATSTHKIGNMPVWYYTSISERRNTGTIFFSCCLWHETKISKNFSINRATRMNVHLARVSIGTSTVSVVINRHRRPEHRQRLKYHNKRKRKKTMMIGMIELKTLEMI